MTQAFNIDCVLGMKDYADNHFDLAVCAPPTGVDCPLPGKEYFDELFRVSKNQVIWGGNFHTDFLKASKCWLVWDKLSIDLNHSDCVLAWTSFNIPIKRFVHCYNVWDRIHPYQEPIELHDWILNLFNPKSILDTHLGSGSSRIAAFKRGVSFTGFEINKDYFDSQEIRFANYAEGIRYNSMLAG